MMRRYFLINENNKRIELRNVKDGILASDLTGLGYENNLKYVKVGNFYRQDSKELKQGIFTSELTFLNYKKYQEFINYIESSERLRVIYKPIDVEYFADVDFESISGVTKNVNMVQCNVTLNRKSLYYTEDNRRFTLESIENESRWPLPFPFVFNDASSLSFSFNNVGHVDAELLAEIYGYIENPIIELFVNGALRSRVQFDIVIQEDEKLLYSAKDGDNYVAIEYADGTQENIPNILKLENDNFFKIPKGQSQIKVTSDSELANKVVFRILTAYKGV